MKTKPNEASTSIGVLGLIFEMETRTADAAPDRPGLILAVDQTREGLFVLGMRPSPSLSSDLYCEAFNKEWQAQAEGVVRLGWCLDPGGNLDLALTAACDVAKAVIHAHRRGERLRAEVLP